MYPYMHIHINMHVLSYVRYNLDIIRNILHIL